MIRIIIFSFLINLNIIFCLETIFPEYKQICRLTIPSTDIKCSDNTKEEDPDFSCCLITLKILNEETQICDYLEYQNIDSIEDEEEKLEKLYNAKDIKISCTSNNSEFFLKINIISLLIILLL